VGEFDGKVAFITGAAHGQGRATALALAKEGARIAAYDVARQLGYPAYQLGTPNELATLARACRELGSECLTLEGDVRDDDAIQRAVSATRSEFGRVDILFNNAGICAYGLSHELSEDEWDAMLDINLKGSWLVGRRVIPVMIAQRSGTIINNASIASLRGVEVGTCWPNEVVGNRVGTAQHSCELNSPDGREYADERWVGTDGRPNAARGRRAIGG
jgi:NAD(P)-dependent dehydrogenase (short-subunit alcohol dehydrogenase family)